MNTGVMRDFNESPIFVLMSDTNTASNTSNHSSRTSAKASSEGQEAREQLERDERLPLSIYETLVTISGEENTARAVFVNMEFELETYGPERIAVETVFKSRPGSNKSKPSSEEKQAANQESMDNISLEESGLDRQMESVTTSISSMNARVAILLDFLTKTRNGDIPPNHALLRQVDGLVRQLPARLTKPSEFTTEYQDMMTLSYLAAVAQTTRIVQGYTEKFDLIHNPDVGSLGGGTSSSRMDMLRGGF
jgi:COP9 signalosome complex subunit 6